MKFVKILWKGIGALVITACSVFESPTQQTLIHYYVQLSEVNLTQADSVAIDYWINNEPQAHHEVQRVVEKMAVFDLETARDNQVIVRVRVYNSGALISTRVDNFVAGVIGAAPDLVTNTNPAYSLYTISVGDTLDLLTPFQELEIDSCQIQSHSGLLEFIDHGNCKLTFNNLDSSNLDLVFLDKNGLKIHQNLKIKTTNRAPVVSQINASATTISIKKYAVLKINSGDFTDADNNLVDSVTWIFSDGASSRTLGKNDTLHVLRNKAQSLTVQAVVRDVWGVKDTAQVSLTYSEGTMSVTGVADINSKINAQIQLNPSVSFSLDQTLTLCEWSINGASFKSVGNSCDTSITLPNILYNNYQAVFRATSDVGVQFLDTLHILIRDGFIDARDGKGYAFVTIGTQVWMAENLNYGTMVLGANGQVNDVVVEKFCYNNDAANCTTDGGLYTWAETMALPSSCNSFTCASQISSGNHQGICPTGWHVPKSDEWNTLATYLGGLSVAGIKMKLNNTGSISWDTGNSNDGNSSGFSAFPAGIYSSDRGFIEHGKFVVFWEATEYDTSYAIFRFLKYSDSDLYAFNHSKRFGDSVRCIRD